MFTLARLLTVIASLIACLSVTLTAQWRDVVTRGVPLTAHGKPNLEASVPTLADGKTTDLSGLWDAEKQPCDDAKIPLGCIDAQLGIPVAFFDLSSGQFPGPDMKHDLTPMHPWAAALVKQRMADFGKDDPLARCLPFPSPRAWSNFELQKIIQTPDSVTILDDYMRQYRQIFLDGRSLPGDPEPTFKGYSVGRWEGDTLVVETIGYKDGLWLDGIGHPLTDQARTIERIRRVNYGNLEVRMTIDDPKAYAKAWATVPIRLRLALNVDQLEYICNENEKSTPHMVGAGDAK
jgi:hypothetical protein